MNPLTEAREHVSGILTSLGMTVYPYPQDSPDLPAAWVTPDSEWAVPRTLAATQVNLTVTLAVGSITRTRDAIGLLEDKVWAATVAFRDKGVQVLATDAPATATHNNLTVHQVPLHVSVLTTDEGA